MYKSLLSLGSPEEAAKPRTPREKNTAAQSTQHSRTKHLSTFYGTMESKQIHSQGTAKS